MICSDIARDRHISGEGMWAAKLCEARIFASGSQTFLFGKPARYISKPIRRFDEAINFENLYSRSDIRSEYRDG